MTSSVFTPGTRVRINESSPYWRQERAVTGSAVGESQPGAVRVLLDERSPLGGTLTVPFGLHELEPLS